MNGGMIVPGTFAKCQRVRKVVAIAGKTDVARTSRFCAQPRPKAEVGSGTGSDLLLAALSQSVRLSHREKRPKGDT